MRTYDFELTFLDSKIHLILVGKYIFIGSTVIELYIFYFYSNTLENLYKLQYYSFKMLINNKYDIIL